MESTSTHPAWIRRLDPRNRVLSAAVFGVVTAAASRWSTLGISLVVAAALVAMAGAPWPALWRRLASLNGVLALLAVLLPLTAGGEPMAHVGPLSVSAQGVRLAAMIVIKANAIAVSVAALIGTLEAAALGHALEHLRVPRKLVHLLLLSVRYLGTIRAEHGRLRAAMALRGFRPGMNRHTYRSYGYLTGMLLVRSLDRSERVVAAMKCRGFRGRLPLLDHFALARHDGYFAAAMVLVVAAMIGAEWL